METRTLWATAFPTPKPILKWAGGKQQLLDVLLSKVPTHYGRYIEPFVGGGALFFAVRAQEPNRAAIIADSNPELVNLYTVVRDDVESLIASLHGMHADEENFYAVRAQNYDALTPVSRAARTIYLNRTCFNGLYRVNRRGQFNVPYGHYSNPTICDDSALRAASYALSGVTILHGDYKDVLRTHARPSDFVFLDPPYLPISAYSDFKRYTKEQFHEDDHRELAEEVHRLHKLGCSVLLTNSNHQLVHQYFEPYTIEVFSTRRSINSVASKRVGEDVVVTIPPKRRLQSLRLPAELPHQMERFPSTRYMGSKQNLLGHIWGVASQFEFNSVLDLFSGTGVVGYMFKSAGKQVITNDYMHFAANFARALIENSATTLTEHDLTLLGDSSTPSDGFVRQTFADLYFTDEDNAFIDTIRANLPRLRSNAKRSLAMAALTRACIKKRPRGIFTFTGHRYDDGRRDLKLSLREQFLAAVHQINQAVFDNGTSNRALCGDALAVRRQVDLVYIDPPYFSPLSDNEYVRRYHFVEGLARGWEGVELQEHTKTKKFRSYDTPFSSRAGAAEAFDAIFKRHRRSILLVSYSSNSLPTMEEMLRLLSNHKPHVEVVAVDHRYSFGNQGHMRNNENNRVKEFLFVGY